MNKTPETSNARKIAEAVRVFGAFLSGAVESLAKSARVYADAVTKYGDEACAAFKKAYPGVTQTTWDKMRLVAKGSLVPETLLLSDRVSARIGYLPLSEQRKMLGGKKTVQVVTPRGTVACKALSSLSPTEEDALFSASGKKRTIAEQREWYADRLADKQGRAAYEVRGNFLVVYRATKIGKAELLDIVRRMK
jgi:hypothetical protein